MAKRSAARKRTIRKKLTGRKEAGEKKLGKKAGKKKPGKKKAARKKVKPTIFISYRHEEPTTMIARRLFTALIAPAEVWGADVFRDEHDLEPADLYDKKILAALDRTTHFIVLLSNSYWASTYCRKELARVVARFEKNRSVRLLFVKVDELNPDHFSLNKDRNSGAIRSLHPVIDKLGDVQFLGPFNGQAQLVRLAWDQPGLFVDQIGQLVNRLQSVIHR